MVAGKIELPFTEMGDGGRVRWGKMRSSVWMFKLGLSGGHLCANVK
jgi:hypothetical protein